MHGSGGMVGPVVGGVGVGMVMEHFVWLILSFFNVQAPPLGTTLLPVQYAENGTTVSPTQELA